MKLVHYKQIPKEVTASVISVGNFDGIHRGHGLLIRQVVSRAKALGIASIIVTFDPHTRAVVSQAGTQQVLSTLEEKAFLLENYGVDYCAWIPFDADFASLSPKEFLETIVKKELRAQEWVMGDEHTFGNAQGGNKNFLQSESGKNHITIFAVSSMELGDTVVSSTEIRKRLIEGDVSRAVEMLGHPYLISGKRVLGLQKGTELGVPTLNFSWPIASKVLPPSGVFAAQFEFNGSKRPGAFYFGNCPTFSNRDFHLEFHEFDYTGSNVPKEGEIGHVWIYKMIRKDAVFASQNELVLQMEKDIGIIKNFFAGEGKWL